MRSKEEANDYRYFPDPDLLPVLIDEAFIAGVRAEMPELPEAKRARFAAEHGLGAEDAALLAASIELAAYFEAVVAAWPGGARLAANWINGDLTAALNRDGLTIDASRVSPAQLAGLLRRIMDGTISGKLGKQVFELLWSGGGDADTIIDRQGLRQITDSGAIEAVIDQVLAANLEQVAEYRAGKTKVMGFLVGQIMKASAGKANPAQVNELLKRKLQG
jgi:aspartyl-tRNA(Asn)/glutamyl-tRNA(Gln) amidotransferase subunit B